MSSDVMLRMNLVLALKVTLNWPNTGIGGEPYGLSYVADGSICEVGSSFLAFFAK